MRDYKGMRYSLLVAGCFVTLIGLVHIFMPTLGYEESIPKSMPKELADHFYYLGTYAICTFLLTLGFISIYASGLKYPDVSFTLSVAFSLLWISRAIFERIYPVRLKLFFLDTPTYILLPFISVIALIYCFGMVSYVLKIRKERSSAKLSERCSTPTARR